MTAPGDCRLIGHWRIVEADIWDQDYLNLCGAAIFKVAANGDGEVAFGAMQATLNVAYAKMSVSFDWEGCDETDEVQGTGWATLEDDGTLEIELTYRNGDEAVLKAVSCPTSSAAC